MAEEISESVSREKKQQAAEAAAKVKEKLGKKPIPKKASSQTITGIEEDKAKRLPR
jgi:hypothetical protein